MLLILQLVMKGVPLNLFKTFIFSIVLLIALTCIYFFFNQHENTGNYRHMITAICTGALYLNAILVIMTSPALFLANRIFWDNRPLRLFLYFGGPLLFIAALLFRKSASGNTLFYFFAGLMFLAIHAIFYSRLLKGHLNAKIKP